MREEYDKIYKINAEFKEEIIGSQTKCIKLQRKINTVQMTIDNIILLVDNNHDNGGKSKSGADMRVMNPKMRIKLA